MTPDTQEPKGMHWAREVPLYPFHFIVRALMRVFRVLAAVIAIALASAVIFAALFLVWRWADGNLNDQVVRTFLIVFTVLASLGLLATVFTKAGQAIKNALIEIGEELLGLAQDWVPQLNVKKSWADAKRDLQEIGPTFDRMYSAPYRIILPLLLIVFLIFSATRIFDADAEWKKGVRAALDSPTVVVVVPAGGRTDHPGHPAPILRPGTTFAIAHVEQGSLKNGNGICLDENISLPWLTAFKKALTQCGGKTPECRPEVVVRAFASVAPIRGEGGKPVAPEAQETLNCEIANRRAEEVVDFLRLGEYKCTDKEWKKRPQRTQYGDGTHCERYRGDFEFGHKDRLPFDIRYEPWQSHGAMVADKPADDGGPPPRARRPELEFFNRSVQLTVRNYGCDLDQCASAAPAGDGANVTEAGEGQTPSPPAAATTMRDAASEAAN